MAHYDTYSSFKSYATPSVGPKHIRRMDAEIWQPGAYEQDMSVLEIGCGTGLVLAYLNAKGVSRLVGVDQDPALAEVVPEAVRTSFRVIDVWAYLTEARRDGSRFDRIILFDVLEHFTPEDGARLLGEAAGLLTPEGRIHLKVPNAGSPWGQQFQYGDLTHRTGYTPGSLRQQAISAGLRCDAVYPQPLGSPSRRFRERLLHGVLDWFLASPPEIWAGNFYALLSKPVPTAG